jgi:hypothetical protein
MPMPRVRFTVRRMTVAVAISGVVFGLLVLAYREGNRRINLVEAGYCRSRAEEETDPVQKAIWVERAAKLDRIARDYGHGW